MGDLGCSLTLAIVAKTFPNKLFYFWGKTFFVNLNLEKYLDHDNKYFSTKRMLWYFKIIKL